MHGLVDVGGHGVEFDAGGGQQFGASRRGRSED
jgi:hypothetical protein